MLVSMMRQRIQRAGFTPCLHLDHLITYDRTHPQQRLKSLRMNQDGYQGLFITSMGDDFARVIKLSGEMLETSAPIPIRDGQIGVIADCFHAESFTVAKVSSRKPGMVLWLTHPLRFSYEQAVFVGPLSEDAFYIHPTRHQLYYGLQRPEALSNRIDALSVDAEQAGLGRLYKVRLGMLNEKMETFHAKIRA